MSRGGQFLTLCANQKSVFEIYIAGRVGLKG